MYKMTRKQEGSEQNNVYKLDRLSSSVDYYCIQKKVKQLFFELRYVKVHTKRIFYKQNINFVLWQF